MKKKLLVIGAGGHSKVVIDAALRSGHWTVVGLIDDAGDRAGQKVLGFPVLGPSKKLAELVQPRICAIVAVGSNGARLRLQGMVTALGIEVATIVHPSATVASSVAIGAGAVVMAGAVINADSVIGDGVIVNTGATVDHDCRLGDFCHVAPGATLCGGVSIGARALVGVGAAIVPGVVVGSDCVIGAGAAVLKSVSDGVRAVGVPAREI